MKGARVVFGGKKRIDTDDDLAGMGEGVLCQL